MIIHNSLRILLAERGKSRVAIGQLFIIFHEPKRTKELFSNNVRIDYPIYSSLCVDQDENGPTKARQSVDDTCVRVRQSRDESYQ